MSPQALIINVAPNGMVPTTEMTPHVPVCEEILEGAGGRVLIDREWNLTRHARRHMREDPDPAPFEDGNGRIIDALLELVSVRAAAG